MAKHDGTDSFKEAATFRVIPGLADKTASSYQAYGDELYLYHDTDNQLTLATMTIAQDSGRATFRLKAEDSDKAEVFEETIEVDELSKTASVNYALVSLIILGLVVTTTLYMRRKRK